jgi:hypothetical protein
VKIHERIDKKFTTATTNDPADNPTVKKTQAIAE